MRKRNSKFNQFIRKVEGKPQHETHDIPVSQVHNWHGTIGYRLEETDYWYEDLELVS